MRHSYRAAWFALAILVSYFTYFHHYWEPNALVWDENYHLASAQKYLNHVFFMEPHPPLGKLLIALGEKCLRVNALNNQFIDTDMVKDLPADFSLQGYRFFPALMAWLTSGVLFWIFWLICADGFMAFCMTGLYIFDNALIAHSRAAMLEGIQIFFISLMLLEFFLVERWRSIPRRLFVLGFLLGTTFGLVMTTKILGLTMILLVPLLIWRLRDQRRHIPPFLGLFVLGFILTYFSVWFIHFNLATRINPQLSSRGYYTATPAYRQLMAQNRHASLVAFPIAVVDSFRYVFFYGHGVPALDLCKSDENGSPFFFWPFGGIDICYRWDIVDSTHIKYVYLQCNPAAWFCGLAAVLMAIVMLAAPLLIDIHAELPHRFWMGSMLLLYLAFMAGISQITRVMYLYHYFVPLVFSYILFAIVWMDLQKIGFLYFTPFWKRISAGLLLGTILGCYLFFSPLTYHRPLTRQQVERRAWLSLWDLHCGNCPRSSFLAHRCHSPDS